jgi:tetratricopeptide (TPR) repeat protein
MTKSRILHELKRDTEAAALRDKAIGMGNAIQLYSFGRQAQIQGSKAEALNYFRAVVKRFPDHWLGHLAQSRLSVAAGDFTGALKEIQAAQAGAPEVNKPALQNLRKRIENKEDINA